MRPPENIVGARRRPHAAALDVPNRASVSDLVPDEAECDDETDHDRAYQLREAHAATGTTSA